MKFCALTSLVSVLLASPDKTMAASHDHEDECTHGKLYVVDNETALVHVFDISEGNLQNLTVETTIQLPTEGAGGLVYYGPPSDPLVVQYRGTEADGFDGFVRVINTGFSLDNHGDHAHIEYSPPSIYDNANVDDCSRPIHQVRHDDKIAIFCDGAYDFEPPINTTIHVIDETKLGSTTESAVVHTLELEGSHHGVAIPVDDGHLMHSVPLPDRVNRVPDTSSTPTTFLVVDYEGKVLHELSDETNLATHCSGFHGSAAIENQFALGCDDDHGAIVLVNYNPATETYTSSAVTYPDDAKFENMRVGSFAYHYKQDHFVGSFGARGGTQYHLLAITPSSTAITDDNVLTLPGTLRQCAYEFEVGSGEHLLVFMPDGVLHVFKVEGGKFQAIMNKEIVPGMSACSEAAFVAGIQQAFVATPETRTMYAIDLEHVDEGEMEVYTSTLPFFPTGMTVSGFSLEAACHEHEHAEPPPPADGAHAHIVPVMGFLVMVAGFFFI